MTRPGIASRMGWGLSGVLFLFLIGCGEVNRQSPLRVTLEEGRYQSLPPLAPPAQRAGPITSGFAEAGWIPADGSEVPGRWEGIIIHHSGTRSGNAAQFDKWHRQQDWDGLGYHFVIDNGAGGPDGRVEVGYRWRNQMTGAHCREEQGDDNYWNEHTIGICLVGNFELQQPTPKQYDSLGRLVRFLQKRYNIPTHRIIGHRDVKPTACPGRYFSWEELRRRLSKE